MARLRCLYGVRDDLHEFAEYAWNTLSFGAMTADLAWAVDHQGVQCAILHRDACYQAELIVVQPGVIIPTHTHPGTDSIEVPVAGAVRFWIDGKDLYRGIDDARLLKLIRGNGLRIAQDAPHGGRALPTIGAMFLSFQRWEGAPRHIGENYVGQGVSPAHASILEAGARDTQST